MAKLISLFQGSGRGLFGLMLLGRRAAPENNKLYLGELILMSSAKKGEVMIWKS